MKNTNKILSIIIILCVFICCNSAHAQLIQTVVALTGNVTNAITKKPVSVTISVNDENGKRINATKSGAADGTYYVTNLKPGQKYIISITSKEYLAEKYEIQIPATDKYEELSKDFIVLPMVKGAKIALTVPPFEENKSKLRVGAEQILDDYWNILQDNPQIKIKIISFPENNNDANFNSELTKSRCEAIEKYFSEHNIDQSRLSSQDNNNIDPVNPPPAQKRAKGKRYIGTTYFEIVDF